MLMALFFLLVCVTAGAVMLTACHSQRCQGTEPVSGTAGVSGGFLRGAAAEEAAGQLVLCRHGGSVRHGKSGCDEGNAVWALPSVDDPVARRQPADEEHMTAAGGVSNSVLWELHH
jgi:hypothetical protein